MDQDCLIDWLAKLLPAHSPGGDEREVDELLLPEFRRWCIDVRHDSAENLIGLVRGKGRGAPLIITAHKDEVAMIVKRIEPHGELHVEGLGGIPPWKYGEGMVDLLTPGGTLPAVMSVGSMHTTSETPRVEEARHQPLDWPMVRVVTGLGREELATRGVYSGTRAVIARSRKGPFLFADCVCGFGLDDKVGLALMLEVMREVSENPPARDIYFVASSAEEQMGCGGSVAGGELPADTMLALEIGPVSEEYGLDLRGGPVVWYRDSSGLYTKSFSDEICGTAERLGITCQRAVYDHAGSDASCARSSGQVGRVGCLSFPADNTHGFEVAPVQGILDTYRVLLAFLRG